MTTTDAPLAAPAVAGRLCDAEGLLPLVAVEIEATVGGLAATTIVRQTFRNARTTGIEATYIFPLPDRAGVTAFTASLAGRLVEADLREREAARAEYDAAIAAGHRAAITEEERPDVFSIRVGNLQPGEEAVITLTLTGPLAVDDGVAEYRFPLVVAPRYVAGQPLPGPPVGYGTSADTDAAPDASRITPPVLLPGLASPVRLSLRARLSGLGLASGDVRSSLHAVTTTAKAGDVIEVSLQPGERLDRDVVLRFPVAAESARAAAAVAPDDEDPTTGTWQVTIVPPAAAPTADSGEPAPGQTGGPGLTGPATPRDVVVVLDRSGSMGGWKMAAARRAAARIVDSLGVQDSFAVLAFDTVTERPPELGDGLVQASDRNRWAAVSWLARLEARGGTEMLHPLRTAATTLAAAAGGPARDRFLILVTDGQVGADYQILAAVAPVAGDTRIFCLGIDRAVNAGFLRRLAALGAGRCELVESQDRLDDVMAALHRRISPPLVTGLHVDADGVQLVPGETTPSRKPDLFPGAPCTLSGRWRSATRPASITLTVSGDGGFREQVTASAAPDRAVRTCWARARVRDLEDSYAAGGASPELADQIVAVSLAHRVLSRFTAFVAVDRSRHTDLGAPQPVVQPVELPAGWAAAGGIPHAGYRPVMPGPGPAPYAAPLGSMPSPAAPGPMPPAAPGPAVPAGGQAGYAAPLGSMPSPAVPPAPRRAKAARFRAARGQSGGRSARPGTGWTYPQAPRQESAAAEPAYWIPLDGYLSRAGELFDRIEQDLGSGDDLAADAAVADELAADLSSVAAPRVLIDALRQLVSALRGAGDPHRALAAARQAFRQPHAPGAGAGGPAAFPSRAVPPGPFPLGPVPPGSVPPDPANRSRRKWWR